MIMGEAQQPDPAPATETPDPEPWYAQPTEAILNFLGDVTYRTDEYTISTIDGQLIIDQRTQPTATPGAAPAAPPGGLLETIGRVPPIVWLGVGGLVLFSIVRR